jgi:hypothetical protein
VGFEQPSIDNREGNFYVAYCNQKVANPIDRISNGESNDWLSQDEKSW